MTENKIKVLVVDDEKIVRDFFIRLLNLQNLEVMDAESGQKAIELVRKSKFDIYFIDVRMPGLDGLATYRQIRQAQPDAMVVMMTGYALEGTLEQAKKEGAHSSIHKPFDITEIMELIDNLSIDKKKSLNILVIDDDPAVINFFSNFLNNKNQKYKAVQNKDEALALLKQEKFDLIFLDLILKDINGVELYNQIKQVSPESDVILITGYPQKAKEIEGKIDIAGYLYKPFEIDGIIKYIEKAKIKK